jgi:hypothetical protein
VEEVNIDKFFCKLPAVGGIMTRIYSYFRKNIAYTDFIHISLGLGIGLLIAGEQFVLTQLQFQILAIFAIAIGLLGHLYAYIKG